MEQTKISGRVRIIKYIPYTIAVLLILAVSITLCYFPNEYAFRQQPPRNQNLNPTDGVWNFTGFDLDNEIVFMEGTVEYVLGEHLTPKQFDVFEGEIHYSKVPDDALAVTARLVFILPEDKLYSLATTTVDYSERTYINGMLYYMAGSPGLTASESTAGKVFTVMDVIPKNGVVTIVRQGSNFVHKEASGYVGYYVGSPENIKQMAAVSQMFSAINIGFYLCLFLLHMVLYLLIRGYRPNLWFALLCFLWLFRAGFMGRAIYFSMFPDIPWALTYRLGCISIAFTGILLLLLVRDQFPGAIQKWPLLVLISVQVVIIPLYIIADTVSVSYVKVVSEILLYVVAIYIAARFVMVLPKQIRLRKLLPEQYMTIIGLIVALFALLHDVIRYNNIAPGIFYYELSDIGILILVIIQTIAMIIGSIRQITEARQTAQMAWETAEIARKKQKLAELRAESAEKDLELQKQLVAIIPPESLIVCWPFTLNAAKRQAFMRDMDLQLNNKEFELLAFFIEQENEIATTEEIYQSVWKQSYVSTDHAFRGTLRRLREKTKEGGYAVNYVRGEVKGYRFEKE